jgi:hypothetical protein
VIQFSITSAFDIGLLLFEHLHLLFLCLFRLLPYRRSLTLQLVHEFGIGVVLTNGLQQKTRAVFDLPRDLAPLQEVDFLTDIPDKGHVCILTRI